MIAALIRQDFRLALSGGALLPLVFALIMLALAGVGLARGDISSQLAAVLFWLSLLLSALLNLERLLEQDARDGTLDLLMLEAGPFSIAAAKILLHWLTAIVPLLALTPLASLFLSLPPDQLPLLLATLLIGSPAISALAGLGAALTLMAQRGSVLAPVLLLPLLIPLLLFGIGAMERAGQGASPAEGLYFLAAASLLALLVAVPATAGALRLATE